MGSLSAQRIIVPPYLLMDSGTAWHHLAAENPREGKGKCCEEYKFSSAGVQFPEREDRHLG